MGFVGTQETVACAFETANKDRFFENQRLDYQGYRATATEMLSSAGLSFYEPAGTPDTQYIYIYIYIHPYHPRPHVNTLSLTHVSHNLYVLFVFCSKIILKIN